jgi:hypothetical protein
MLQGLHLLLTWDAGCLEQLLQLHDLRHMVMNSNSWLPFDTNQSGSCSILNLNQHQRDVLPVVYQLAHLQSINTLMLCRLPCPHGCIDTPVERLLLTSCLRRATSS